MSTVGSGFGAFTRTTQSVRRPVNPMDKSTIVSIVPRKMVEIKPTVFPGRWIIPGVAKSDDFELLVVHPSSWFREIDESQPLLEIPHTSYQMAESIITDCCNGMLAVNMVDRMPGLFFIAGEWNKKNIASATSNGRPDGIPFKTLLESARSKQNNWFLELVRLADIDWARTQGNPLSISDDSRMAAERLGITKPWAVDFKAVSLENCKSCGEMINPQYPVCRYCKAIINVAKAQELGLKFVQ